MLMLRGLRAGAGAPRRLFCCSTVALRDAGSTPPAGPSITTHVEPQPQPKAPAAANAAHVPPLTVPLAGLPASNYRLTNNRLLTQITTLDNGLRVASEDAPGSWCTVGAVVDVGPRYENPPYIGAAHVLDRLAFKSTKNNAHSDMLKKMERLGGNFITTANKESLLYMASVFRNDVSETLDLLAEATLRPAYTEDEIEEQKVLIGYENEDLINKPDALVVELLHEAAYGSSGLGQRQVCLVEDAATLTSKRVHEFHQAHFTPARMVITGAGVDHESFVAEVQKRFGGNVFKPAVARPSVSKQEWMGGICVHEMDESPSNNALGIPLTQLAIGFKGFGWRDEEIFPSAVLQILLGGGGSFSSGGPGKGMYSRFYQRILNVHHWIESALAVNLSYSDTGLFMVQGSARPEDMKMLAGVLLSELKACSNFIANSEFDRAKKQLKSSLMMNLESRSILFEDIGRQIIARNSRYSADEMCARIDAVTKEDVMGLLKRMTSSRPAIAAVGNINDMPLYDDFLQFKWK